MDYWLALALSTRHEISGNLDPVSKFVQVRIPLATVTWQECSVGTIVGCTQVIPGIATSRKTADGQNE